MGLGSWVDCIIPGNCFLQVLLDLNTLGTSCLALTPQSLIQESICIRFSFFYLNFNFFIDFWGISQHVPQFLPPPIPPYPPLTPATPLTKENKAKEASKQKPNQTKNPTNKQTKPLFAFSSFPPSPTSPLFSSRWQWGPQCVIW